MKKVLKITTIFLLLLVSALIITPYLLKDKIQEIVLEQINNTIEAEVSLSEFNISLLKNFPDLNIDISELEIKNKGDFENETLAKFENLTLSTSFINYLSNGNISIKNFSLENAFINLITNKEGFTNYDISKESLKDEKTINSAEKKEENINEEENKFNLHLENYTIKNFNLKYEDQSSNILFELNNFNHNGSGVFTGDKLSLKTQTDTYLHLDMEDTNYIKNTLFTLDAIFDIDLENNKYSFKDNKATYHGIPLNFNGFVQLIEEDINMSLDFENPNSNFKDIFKLIPPAYQTDLDGISANGNFSIKGNCNGIYNEASYPKFNLSLLSKKGRFKFPDLKREVTDIDINIDIKNKTNQLNTTTVDINAFNFKIGEDHIKSEVHITDVIDNPFIKANINTFINLEHLQEAYPIPDTLNLKGILDANLITEFDNKSLEDEIYENIKHKGYISLNSFETSNEILPKTLKINKSKILFNEKEITLEYLEAKTGSTDFKANGNLVNVLGYTLKNEELKGNLNINSNYINTSDLLLAEEVSEEVSSTNKNQNIETSKEEKENSTIPEEQVKIPELINFNLKLNCKEILYDNISLKNSKGELIIKDQVATISQLKSTIFKGTLNFKGSLNTKEPQSKFTSEFIGKNLDIVESFNNLNTLKYITPLAKTAKGRLNLNMDLAGNLKNDLSQDNNSLNGKGGIEIINGELDLNKNKLISQLSSQFNILKSNKLNLDKTKASFNIENGKVIFKPIPIKIDGLKANIGGYHSLEDGLKYSFNTEIPGTYLKENLDLSFLKLNDNDLEKIKIPISSTITGDVTNPKLNFNKQKVIKELQNQVIASQKDKLKDEAQKEANKLADDLIESNIKDEKTKEVINEVKDGINNILGGFGKKKKKK